jgi:hypothetical protein
MSKLPFKAGVSLILIHLVSHLGFENGKLVVHTFPVWLELTVWLAIGIVILTLGILQKTNRDHTSIAGTD